MMAQPLLKVFVYGTLKAGFPNYQYLANKLNGFSKFFAKGRTKNIYPLVIGTRYNIPFLLDRPGIGHQIQGEIYEIDDDMLSYLDIFEDYPSLYHRRSEDITTENGIYSCEIYVLKEFPQRMLNEPFLAEYINTSEKPYSEKSKRIENIPVKNDL